MPPFIQRKRQLSPSSQSLQSPTRQKTGHKPTLFDTADARSLGSLEANQRFLNEFADSSSETSLSDLSSVDFEDVIVQPPMKKHKAVQIVDEDEDEDEQIDWEDAIQAPETLPPSTAERSANLLLTLDDGFRTENTSDNYGRRKAPNRLQRQIRIATHCMHVQFLMFHNSVRSQWACNPQVQRVLLENVSPTARKEIQAWKLASGFSSDPPRQVTDRAELLPKNQNGGSRNQRDWGSQAERQEEGFPDMSQGDPIIRLLKGLATYWKKKFSITAPGLRKQGYKSEKRLSMEIGLFETNKHDINTDGEQIKGAKDFCEHATMHAGSRDVGVQLFVSLLRGLGLEARLVASLQPIGFGWSKNEEAFLNKKPPSQAMQSEESNDSASYTDTRGEKSKAESSLRTGISHKKGSAESATLQNMDNARDGQSTDTIENPQSISEEDDDFAVDATPSGSFCKPELKSDREMTSPTYWAEVVSPITKKVYSVDPFILKPAVATSPAHYAAFAPRGVKSDKSKQVFAYVVAFSPDGTAKDVTVRYLKNHAWPGKTKGVRIPTEKLAVYNSRGKIKHHEDFDWFKTVMSDYTRPDTLRTIVDDIEDNTDLKLTTSEKKETKASEGTLQFYKSSAEFVLERHLRREEALVPGAEPVRTFWTGKGEIMKDEPVFRREDVEICRTSESWHKEGRKVKPREQPLKMVPIRAVTLTRKREVQEAERDGGEKLKQGLYSREQTEWIIPPPIRDGIIPKNEFNNIDCFVPTMIPAGAAHIPLRSTAKICKRLGIDFAEAVTGFEFGKQRAVPVITGVVVASENETLVLDEWQKDEQHRRIKEEGKHEKAALVMWRKMLMGLRIIQRVKGEYGDAGGDPREDLNPFTNRNKQGLTEASKRGTTETDSLSPNDSDTAGGFVVGGTNDDTDFEGGFIPQGQYEEERSPSPIIDDLTVEKESKRHEAQKRVCKTSKPPNVEKMTPLARPKATPNSLEDSVSIQPTLDPENVTKPDIRRSDRVCRKRKAVNKSPYFDGGTEDERVDGTTPGNMAQDTIRSTSEPRTDAAKEKSRVDRARKARKGGK